ncbi:MAG: hypothetical protein JNL83_30930 [Myxococcales bacterium]|nr:hypothetical protein [Myxococcales bacterium]
MKLVLSVVLFVGCGGGARGTDPVPSNTAAIADPAPPVTVQASFIRQLVEDERRARHVIWLERDHAGVLDTKDECCGISYDGDKYNDRITTCATAPDTCAAGTAPVYPGIAADPICKGQRRCVPYPEARVVVTDGTQVTALDAEDQPLPQGDARVAHRPVTPGREGFITVTVGGATQRVALDYGSRYTIVVERGQIDRIGRD